MGAPKHKWTPEEESALKAGVVKHGAGKWRIILKDPDFSNILHMRTNVDLKDKWRNIKVTPICRPKQRKEQLAVKKNPSTPKIEKNPEVQATPLEVEERPKYSPKAEKIEVNILSKSEIIIEISKMRGMTAQELAIAAAKAVAEAEIAIVEAEEANREAEAAEAEAEDARMYAKSIMKELKHIRLNS